MQSVKTKEDIVRWAAGFTTALPDLIGEPELIVSRIIENALLANMADNDSSL